MAYRDKEKKRIAERAACKRWRKRHPDRQSLSCKNWAENNRVHIVVYNRRLVAELREKVIAGYGGKCQCPRCIIDTKQFMEIHHVNNGGAKHRRERSPVQIYRDIIKANFPPEFAVLCANCHRAISSYGVCPHEAEVIVGALLVA